MISIPISILQGALSNVSISVNVHIRLGRQRVKKVREDRTFLEAYVQESGMPIASYAFLYAASARASDKL